MAATDGGRGKWEVLVQWYEVSVVQDEQVLEIDLVLHVGGAHLGHARKESHRCAQVKERVTTEQDDDDFVHLENILQSVTLKNKVRFFLGERL